MFSLTHAELYIFIHRPARDPREPIITVPANHLEPTPPFTELNI